jgi:hypothetical protein
MRIEKLGGGCVRPGMDKGFSLPDFRGIRKLLFLVAKTSALSKLKIGAPLPACPAAPWHCRRKKHCWASRQWHPFSIAKSQNQGVAKL